MAGPAVPSPQMPPTESAQIGLEPTNGRTSLEIHGKLKIVIGRYEKVGEVNVRGGVDLENKVKVAF